MNITISRSTDETILGACGIAPRNPTKSVLSQVLLTDNTIRVTDLEKHLVAEMEVEVQSTGSVCLSASKLSAIIKATSGPIRLNTNDNSCQIKTDGASYNLPTIDPDEFPAPPTVSEFAYTVDASFLRSAIERTIYATDTESRRYALGGILFDFTENHLDVVATDGRRLSKVAVDATGPAREQADVIVPSSSAQSLLKLLPSEGTVEIGINRTVCFRFGSTMFYANLLEGRFPKWQASIPNYEESCEFNVDDWMSAIKQVKITTGKESRGVRFTISNGKVTIKASDASEGESEAQARIKSDHEVFAEICIDYVEQFLSECEGTASVWIEDEDKPILFESNNQQYVVMPLSTKK